MKPMNDELLPILASRLEYGQLTGQFVWRRAPELSGVWNARCAGKPAGSVGSHGYVAIGISHNGKTRSVLAHRVAWFIATGRAPVGEIDHIDGDIANNKISNLREVSRTQNMRNARMLVSNTSGVAGVSWHKVTQKWRARAQVNDRVHCVGLFANQSDAERALRDFRAKNGFTERHGRAA